MKEIVVPLDNQITPDYNLYVLQLSQRYQTGYMVMDVIERHMTLAGFHPDAAWLFENVPGLKYYTRNNLLTPGEPLVLHVSIKGDREHVARRYEIPTEA